MPPPSPTTRATRALAARHLGARILRALRAAHGNAAEAARSLSLPRPSLYRHLAAVGWPRARIRARFADGRKRRALTAKDPRS